jgi:hypothetical protein
MLLINTGIGKGDVILVGVVFNKFTPLSTLKSDSLVRVRDVLALIAEESKVLVANFWA